MIGDIKDYSKFVQMIKKNQELEVFFGEFIFGVKKEGDEGDDFDDDVQVCFCQNVIKGDIVSCVKDGICIDIGVIKMCIKVGIGCGGCMFFVMIIFNKIMFFMGNEVKNYVCLYFNYFCVELYYIVMVKCFKFFLDVMCEVGNDFVSDGCEFCKFVVGSIFVLFWNCYVMDKFIYGLQDINDWYFGNIQCDGIYFVVFCVFGGEIIFDKFVVIGEVVQKYGLYIKIIGG